MMRGLGVLAVGFAATVAALSSPEVANAQSRTSFQDIFNSVAGAAEQASRQRALAEHQSARQNATLAWSTLSPQMNSCIDVSLRGRNLSVNTLSQEGISPTDPRLSILMQRCNALTSYQLQTNIPCTVNDSQSHPVQSYCDETYIRTANGSSARISYEEFVNLSIQGQQTGLGKFERPDARQERLAKEAAQAVADKAAAEAAQQRVLDAAEAAQKRVSDAAEAARKRASEATLKANEQQLGSFKPF